MEPTEQYAILQDEQDELRKYRNEYIFPQHESDNVVYFCGNSLGLQHKDVTKMVLEHLQKWGTQAVAGHFIDPLPWFEIDDELREQMALIVGALRDEVVLCNTLTTNLHLLLVAFYRPTDERPYILTEKNPFPSDMYALRSQINERGYDPDKYLIEIGPREGETFIRTEDIIDLLDKRGGEIATVCMSGVHFQTGQLFEMEAITKKGHEMGCMVGFDLAHAAGNAHLQLHEWQVDFACWCTYKYLNGGPGNLGGLFVHSRHDVTKLKKFEGWWGNRRETRFAPKHQFDSSTGAASFQLSNPIVLGVVSLFPSIDLMAKIGMIKLRSKSERMTSYLEFLIKEHLSKFVSIITPPDPSQRGCQLSLMLAPPKKLVTKSTPDMPSSAEDYEVAGKDELPFAAVVQKELEERGVRCDKRPPNVLRVAPVPLYNNFHDIWILVNSLRGILPKHY